MNKNTERKEEVAFNATSNASLDEVAFNNPLFTIISNRETETSQDSNNDINSKILELHKMFEAFNKKLEEFTSTKIPVTVLYSSDVNKKLLLFETLIRKSAGSLRELRGSAIIKDNFEMLI